MAKYGFAHGQSYTTDDWARFFAGFIGDGVLPGPATNQLMIVEDNGMTVGIRPGYGYIQGRYLCADGNETFTIGQADGTLHRIDRVVLRLDKTDDSAVMKLAVLKGTPNMVPEPPPLTRNGTIYEMCLAEIAIPAGATSITQDLITDSRGTESLCGWSTMMPKGLNTDGLFAQYQAEFKRVLMALGDDDHITIDINEIYKTDGQSIGYELTSLI